MGRRKGRKRVRKMREHRAESMEYKSGSIEHGAEGMEHGEKSERKEKFESPSDPAEGIYVTYEMFGPDTKMVVDRIFRDRKRAEYIANL